MCKEDNANPSRRILTLFYRILQFDQGVLRSEIYWQNVLRQKKLGRIKVKMY